MTNDRKCSRPGSIEPTKRDPQDDEGKGERRENDTKRKMEGILRRKLVEDAKGIRDT